MNIHAALLVGFVLAASHLPSALAQAGGHMMVGDTLVYPGDAAYPAGLAARGVQGRAVVRVSVDAEGKAAATTIGTSSRSRELDDAALALARSYPYPPAKKGAAGSETLVTFRFLKDRPADLPKKTCADFNIDKAWFSATFPWMRPGDMDVVKAIQDRVIFTLPGPQQMPYARNSSAVAAAAIAACATRPGDTLFALMQQEAAKLPPK